MTKYIVFKQRNLLIPILLPECATHSMVKLEEAVVDSAGFYCVDRKGQIIVQQKESESLKIGPKTERDAKLIENVLIGSQTMHFLDFDSID